MSFLACFVILIWVMWVLIFCFSFNFNIFQRASLFSKFSLHISVPSHLWFALVSSVCVCVCVYTFMAQTLFLALSIILCLKAILKWFSVEIIPSFNHTKKITVSLKASFSRTYAYTFHVALNINVFVTYNLSFTS